MAEINQPMGTSMASVTITYGIFLIIWGVVISLLSGFESVTSLIPSMLGIPLLFAGFMTNKQPEKRKLWMHVAATFGLLCALGGMRFFTKMSEGLGYASGSMLMLLLTGSGYTFLCVRSFIEARKTAQQ